MASGVRVLRREEGPLAGASVMASSSSSWMWRGVKAKGSRGVDGGEVEFGDDGRPCEGVVALGMFSGEWEEGSVEALEVLQA